VESCEKRPYKRLSDKVPSFVDNLKSAVNNA